MTQNRVLEVLSSLPGASTARVARALEMDHSTAAYHLRRLERSGAVSSIAAGRERRHYPKGHPSCPFLRATSSLMDSAACARILETVRARPLERVSDVARASGIDVQATRWAVSRLENAGLVARLPGGRLVVPEETRECVPHLLEGSRCGQWGRCAVSRSPWRRLVLGAAAEGGAWIHRPPVPGKD